MTAHMMILEVAEGAEFDNMPEDLQKAIQKAGVTWPESIMLGTQPVNGKQLILINAKVDADTLTDLMNNDEFDENGNQIKFNLGWSVVAREDQVVNQSALLSYYLDVPVFDELGEVAGYEAVADLTGKIQVWAGKKWMY